MIVNYHDSQCLLRTYFRGHGAKCMPSIRKRDLFIQRQWGEREEGALEKVQKSQYSWDRDVPGIGGGGGGPDCQGPCQD